MSGNIFTGASYFVQGLTLILKPGIRKFVIIPLLINIIVFAVLAWFAVDQFSTLMDWFMASLPGWLQWLDSLLWLLFLLVILLLYIYCFSMIANLIASPFNGFLSEAVEDYLRAGKEKTQLPNRPFVTEVFLSVINEVKKLGYFAMIAIPLLLLFLIPGLNIVAVVLWGLFSAWTLALEYIDYPMGNHGINFKETRRQLAKQRLMYLGFGAAVMIVILVPFLNLLVMPAAVAGATKMYVNDIAANNQATAVASSVVH